MLDTESLDPRIAAKVLKKRRIAILKEQQKRKGVTPLDHIQEHNKQLLLTLSPHISRWFFGGNRDLAYGSQIRMADGSVKNIEDIQIGDMILAWDGENSVPTKVVDIPFDGEGECYRFKLKGGAEFFASDIHEFPVVVNNMRGLTIKKGKDIAELNVPVNFSSAGIQMFSGETPPFSGLLLGLYLGDGSFGDSPSSGYPRPNFTNTDPDILDLFSFEIASCFQGKLNCRPKPSDSSRLFVTSVQNKKSINPFINSLKDLKLVGKSDTKFIPDIFKKADAQTRKGIIRGLILTDGHVSECPIKAGGKIYKDNSVCIYSNSLRLMEDTQEVLLSLGIPSRINKRNKRLDHRDTWKEQYYLKFSSGWLFKRGMNNLLRKTALLARKRISEGYLRLEQSEFVGKLRTRCLTVDHPSSTFILSCGVVTLNTGKSEWGAHECARFLHKRHPAIPLSKQVADFQGVPWIYEKKDIQGWACCPSFDVQEETTQEKLMALLDPNRILFKQFMRGEILKKIRYKADDGTTSTLHFKSYEQGRTKFQGAGKDFIWFDEEPPKDVYDEASIRSKAGFPLYSFCTMTPVNGCTWVYDDIWMATDKPTQKVVTASWADNQFLTEQQRIEMKSRFPEEVLAMREHGNFVQRTGLVCSWFRRDKNMLEDGKDIMDLIPKGCDVYATVDFGFSKPCCVLYVAVDYDNNFYVFDGFYKTGLTTPHLKMLMQRKEQNFKQFGLQMRTRYCDNAQAADIAEMATKTLGPDGKEYDPMIFVPVQKETGTSKESWDEYRSRLMDQHGRVSPMTGKSKVIVSGTLIELDSKRNTEFNFFLREAENLRWEERKVQGILHQKARWKDSDSKHCIDCFSYLLKMIIEPPERPEARRKRERELENQNYDSLQDDGWVL